MIKIFDNFLSPSYADAIEQDVKTLHYQYLEKTSEYVDSYLLSTDQTMDYGQFSCPLVHSEMNQPNFYFMFLKPLLFITQDNSGISFEGMVRLKANILLRQADAPKDHYNIPHQDATSECYSLVYYCNDSDGDTFLFNEFYDEHKPPERLTISQRVSPKKNRAVLFESHRFHASSNPINCNARFVLNFVLRKRDN